MKQLDEIKIMNDTMINYLKKSGVSSQRNEIIKKMLEDDACFFKMNKDDAFLVLNEVGIKENTEKIYSNLISSDVFYELYKDGKLDVNDSEVIIKYKIYS